MSPVWGILLPHRILESPAFSVFAAFVALNTLLYVTLSVAKILPKLYVSDWLPQRARRAETRSIHPDGPVDRDAGPKSG